MPWTLAAHSRALQAVFGGALMIGLRTEDGREVTDASYERQPVEMIRETPGSMVNLGEVQFAAYTAASLLPVTEWFLVEGDTELAHDAIENAETPREGWRPYFAPGALAVRLEG